MQKFCIQQGCIKLIKKESKDIFQFKDLYFK